MEETNIRIASDVLMRSMQHLCEFARGFRYKRNFASVVSFEVVVGNYCEANTEFAKELLKLLPTMTQEEQEIVQSSFSKMQTAGIDNLIETAEKGEYSIELLKVLIETKMKLDNLFSVLQVKNPQVSELMGQAVIKELSKIDIIGL